MESVASFEAMFDLIQDFGISGNLPSRDSVDDFSRDGRNASRDKVQQEDELPLQLLE